MADEVKTPVEPTQDPAPKVDVKVYNGKYNSVEELEKAHQELETKLGQQGDEVKTLRQFQAEVYPIVDIVYSDDKIMSDIRKAADTKYNAPTLDTKTETPENGKAVEAKPDPRVSEQESFLRQQAIDAFKAKNGLNALPTEDYAKVEEQLTKVMSRWILPGQPVSIDRVGNLLEDAYSIVRNEKLVEDKVFESLANQQTNQRATMSPLSGSPSDDSGADLSEDERRIASKLGVKPEDAAFYKKRYAEGNDESIIKNQEVNKDGTFIRN